MRNYWALLPAIAVLVVLILVYAVPTLINPQWTSTVLGLFRQQDENAQPTVLNPQQVYSRRMLAAALVAGVLALVGFNVSLNREANGCYQAAKAWGAVDSEKATADPCVNMIYGSFIGDGTGKPLEENPQPVTAYQLVKDKRPKYLRWIQNRPSYDDLDLVIGVGGNCALDLKVVQGDDKITLLSDTSEPCPADTSISINPVKLDKPLGDRKIVTVGDKPVKEISPDLDSWGTVLKKLVTGG
ncbi:MAG TPA: hypothetical protein VFT31_05020 [Kribbella sp.]|nr:hypothetical protein [Kribbella sp.]